MSGSGQGVTTTTVHGPGQMGLSGTINIGSTNNHLRRVKTRAELFKYSELFQCHLVKTEKNSSVRKKNPMFLQEDPTVYAQVAPRVGKLCLAVVTNGSTLHPRPGRAQRIIANSLG